jgi:hypothetical protein
MINFTDMTGLASSAVAMTAMVVMLPGVARLQRIHFALLICAIAIAVLIPFGGLPLAAYVRGWIGDLSITSLVLLTLMILRPLCGRSPSDVKAKTALLILIAFAALALYPLALGVDFFDPYRLGYGNPWFMGGLLLLALAAWFRRLQMVTLAIALAVFLWGVGWYESTNLWDYLLDPLLAIYAISALVQQSMQTLWKLRPG